MSNRGRDWGVLALLVIAGLALGYGLRGYGRSIEANAIDQNASDPQNLVHWEHPSEEDPIKYERAEGEPATTQLPASMEDVLSSVGLDTYAVLASFLSTANSASIESLASELVHTGKLSAHFADTIFVRWAEVDPERAVAFAKETGWTRYAVWAWAKQDPEAALAYGLENGSGISAIRAVAQGDPKKGLALLEEYPQLAGTDSWEGIVSGLADTDLRGAVKFALSRGVSSQGALRKWVLQDEEAAVQFAKSLENPRQRVRALHELLPSLFDRSNTRARELVESLPEGRLQLGLARKIAELSSDIAATEQWSETLSSPLAVEAIHQMLAARVTETDPDEALRLISKSGEFDSKQLSIGGGWHGYSSVSGDIIRALAHTRPEEISHLVEALIPRLKASDNLNHLEYYTGELLRVWTYNDSESASQWAAGLSDPEARAQATPGVVSGLLARPEPDFESAIQWAASLPEKGPIDKSDLVTMVVDRWVEETPQALLDALSVEGIPSRVLEKYKTQVEARLAEGGNQ